MYKTDGGKGIIKKTKIQVLKNYSKSANNEKKPINLVGDTSFVLYCLSTLAVSKQAKVGGAQSSQVTQNVHKHETSDQKGFLGSTQFLLADGILRLNYNIKV